MISYALVGDEQAFNRFHFRSPTWWNHSRNGQHFAVERGRLAVACDSLAVDLLAQALVTVHIPLRSSPHETHYKVALEYGLTSWSYQTPSRFRHRVRSGDLTGGLHVKLDSAYTTTSVSGQQLAAARQLLQCDPPIPALDYPEPGLVRIDTGWHVHPCDPDLDSDRYLDIEVAQPGIPPAEDRVQVYLVGVYAFGFSPEAP